MSHLVPKPSPHSTWRNRQVSRHVSKQNVSRYTGSQQGCPPCLSLGTLPLGDSDRWEEGEMRAKEKAEDWRSAITALGWRQTWCFQGRWPGFLIQMGVWAHAILAPAPKPTGLRAEVLCLFFLPARVHVCTLPKLTLSPDQHYILLFWIYQCL